MKFFLSGLLTVIIIINAWGEPLTLERVLSATMKNQHDILMQKLSAEAAEGARIAAAGSFDTQLSASLSETDSNTPLAPYNSLTSVDSKVRKAKFSVSKTLRSGVNVTGQLAASETIDNTYGTPDENINSAAVAVSIPLYDIITNNAAGLQEKSAAEDKRAAVFRYYHQISASLYNCLSAWWTYLTYYELMKIYENSRDSTGRYLKDYKKLVEAGERPSADLYQLEAQYRYIAMEAKEAEKNFMSAGYSLCTAAGMDCDGDPLPEPSGEWLAPELLGSIDDSTENRFDILSAAASLESAKLLTEAYKRGEKPDISISFSLERKQSKEKLFGYSSQDNSGTTVYSQIDFSTYHENSAAIGQLYYQMALYRQAKLRLTELRRTAAIDLQSAVAELKYANESVSLADETVELYAKALEMEKRKQSLGMSTVLDVLGTSTKHRDAMLERVSYQLNAASAAVKYLYVSGGLIRLDNGKVSLNKLLLPDTNR